MSDPTFEIGAKDFARLVRPLVPLAEKDGMLPLLNAVRFESQDYHLIGMVTDRFRLGIHRTLLIDGQKPPANLSFSLSLSSIAKITSLFKAGRFSDPALRFTITDGDRVRVEQTGGFGFDFMDASLTLPIVEGDFPKVREIVAKTLASEEAELATNVAFNAAYLADFRHAITDATPLVMRPRAGSTPTLVMAGDDFVGCIMPVRVETADTEFAAWGEYLNPPKKRAASKRKAKVA